MRHEQQTESHITTLRDMVTALSKAMWENEDPAKRAVKTGKDHIPQVKRLDSQD